MDFSNELSTVVTENTKVMKSLNLAVQSGSNRILTKMNRHYTAERFLEIVSGLREKCPNFNLSSDIIVGFPSETDEDFQLSLDLVQKANFSMIYIGKYSPRKGTVASKAYKNDIPLVVKKEREQVLKKLLDTIKKEGNENWLGKKVRVLVKGAKRGISFYNHEIIFESPLTDVFLGHFVDCEVIATTTSGLMCKVL
jgi:tRNA-2-methylthio-N6-dimethylallyladenosine synthase